MFSFKLNSTNQVGGETTNNTTKLPWNSSINIPTIVAQVTEKNK